MKGRQVIVVVGGFFLSYICALLQHQRDLSQCAPLFVSMFCVSKCAGNSVLPSTEHQHTICCQMMDGIWVIVYASI